MIELSMNEVFGALVIVFITSAGSGALGAIISIKVMKKEIEWMNKILAKHDKEIDRLHDRMSTHISVHHAVNHDVK